MNGKVPLAEIWKRKFQKLFLNRQKTNKISKTPPETPVKQIRQITILGILISQKELSEQ